VPFLQIQETRYKLCSPAWDPSACRVWGSTQSTRWWLLTVDKHRVLLLRRVMQHRTGEYSAKEPWLARSLNLSLNNMHATDDGVPSYRSSTDGYSSTSHTPTGGLRGYLPRILFSFTSQLEEQLDNWSTHTSRQREAYEDASSIDWSYEDARERSRMQELSELRGLR
jgi:hypothetical protein